jgi:hypothetical protein
MVLQNATPRAGQRQLRQGYLSDLQGAERLMHDLPEGRGYRYGMYRPMAAGVLHSCAAHATCTSPDTAARKTQALWHAPRLIHPEGIITWLRMERYDQQTTHRISRVPAHGN